MIAFNEDAHEYRVDGVPVPSVTQIIRFLAVDTAVAADPALRAAAADRGSRVHAACLAYDYDSEDIEIDGDITGHVQAYAKFCRDYRIKDWLLAETPLGINDPGCAFAGTPDRLGLIDKNRVLVDIKTGGKINKLQCGAQLYGYSTLLERTGRGFADDGWILHLRKDGSYTVHCNAITHDAGRAFWKCYDLQNLIAGGKQ